jgi:hypothetical protein
MSWCREHVEGARSLGSIAAIAAALAAAQPARADLPPSCGWIQSIQHWDASFGWSWSHEDHWTTFSSTLAATTQDAGSGTASLDSFLSGDIDGQLTFDDYLEDDGLSDVTFTHTVLSGPIVGGVPGVPSHMFLQLDGTDCTYTWSTDGPWAAGTQTTEVGSEAIVTQPNAILPGTHPIPPLPGPLSFSGPAPVVINATLNAVDPQFVTYGDASTASGGRTNAPPLGNAAVSWSFDPGNGSAPLNDSCVAGSFLLGSATQDTSFATSDASDPASSCGGGDRSVWFFFFAPVSGIAEISTAGSGYSTIVSVWPVAQVCGALTTQVACAANGASAPVQRNTAYRVEVQRSAPAGTGALHVTVSVPEPAATSGVLAAIAGLAISAQTRRAAKGQ